MDLLEHSPPTLAHTLRQYIELTKPRIVMLTAFCAVIGMVLAFSQIQSIQGTVKPSDLAGGIWEALLTTVFGLVVAIPCMALYHALEGHADKIARRMEWAVTALDDLLSPSSPSTVTTKPRQRAQEEEFSTVQ
jgi:heme O synthase-like polyprenyltransferase